MVLHKLAPVTHFNAGFAFPQEIVNVIIDELASQRADNIDCMDALCSSLLVSRAFYYASRKWIFYKVELDFHLIIDDQDGDNHKSAWFRALLDGNQDLAKQVRVLRLDLHSAWDNLLPKNISDMQGRADQNFPCILDRLRGKNVHTLELQGHENGFNLAYFPDEVLASLFTIRCSPSFKTLVLDHLDSLPRPLLMGVSAHDKLRSLSINNLRLAESYNHRLPLRQAKPNTSPAYLSISARLEAASNTTEPPFPCLELLETDEPCGFLDFVQSFDRPTPYPSIHFISLRSLSIGKMYQLLHFADIGDLLPTAPNLVTLNFEADVQEIPDDMGSINLGMLPSLKSLNWIMFIWHRIDNVPVFIIRKLLQQTQSPINIESLTVSLRWWFSEVDQEPLVLDPSTEWAELDEVVTSWRLPSLRKITVSLHFQYVWTHRCTSEQLEAKARQARDLARHIFPRVSAQRRLELDVAVGTGIDAAP